MKSQQIFSPKYWIFHNVISDDVFIDTASKSLEGCKEKASSLYKNEFNHYENDDHSCFEFCLFELNIVLSRV